MAFQSALTFTSAPAAIPSSLVLSAALIEPATVVVAAVMLMAGVVPPDDTIGAVPVTEETMVGLFDRSLYDPDVATVARVGLFNICASPLTAFQSAFTFTSAPVAIPSSFVLSADDMLPAAD